MKNDSELTYRKFLISYEVWLYILEYSKKRGIGISEAADNILKQGIEEIDKQ